MDHRIDLIDPIEPPPHPQLHRMSKNELITIKCTISDYMTEVGPDQIVAHKGTRFYDP